jgi:hypothetical protein
MSAGHDHGHAPAGFNAAFGIGIGLNIAFVAVEAFYGWKIDSLALLADAGHNLSDVIGLVLAWGGALAGKLRPNARHTYGCEPVILRARHQPVTQRTCHLGRAARHDEGVALIQGFGLPMAGPGLPQHAPEQLVHCRSRRQRRDAHQDVGERAVPALGQFLWVMTNFTGQAGSAMPSL